MRSPQQSLGLTQTQRLALNTSLQASISILRSDAAGLTRYLEEQAAENPHLRLDPPPAPGLRDWLPRWSGVFRAGGQMPEAAAASSSLISHVLAGIAGLGFGARDGRIAMALAEILEPSGWLGGDLAGLAREVDASLSEVDAVVEKLQQLEPTGIFARNLADCLRLQAIEADEYDATMQAILAHLDVLAGGDLARTAQVCGITSAQVLAKFRIIRGMNPKPGAEFAPLSATALREPDLLAQATATGWSLALNHSALPSVQINAAATGGGLSAAKSLQRMVKARNATLLLVGQEILARQQDALRLGPSVLKPMNMAELAESLGFHESTISRVVAGASMDTPRGTWWLRHLFSANLAPDGQPAFSAIAMRHRLARLVSVENPERPLSDQALAQALAIDTGITIARRTVAKYREMQGIAPAHLRKRKPVLPRLGRNSRSEG
jgi:RNA polymerase sigma-54 factor